MSIHRSLLKTKHGRDEIAMLEQTAASAATCTLFGKMLLDIAVHQLGGFLLTLAADSAKLGMLLQ